MSEQREPKTESLNGARVRFLLLGLIIGASAIVALTNEDPSFGTANVVQQAMPSASSLPGAIVSAILPRTPPGAASAADPSARIPEVDVSRLPKAAPEPSAGAPAKRAAAGKGKKKGEPDTAKKPAAAPAAGESALGMPPGFEQVLEGMQGFGGAFKSDD